MISIIIASYNQAEYLSEAIESCLEQTSKPDEIIIVNDGSTDGSLEVARRYEAEYDSVKVINQVNKGLSSARNAGIMFNQSTYILPLDADDVLLPNCIEKILETIKKTGADIVSPSFKTFGTTNELVILTSFPTLADFRTGNRVAYCSAIKAGALLEVGGYSSRMIYGYEDLHLTINLLTIGKKLVTIPEILWKYRTKEHSMINVAQEHHKELLDQINKDFPTAKLNF